MDKIHSRLHFLSDPSGVYIYYDLFTQVGSKFLPEVYRMSNANKPLVSNVLMSSVVH